MLRAPSHTSLLAQPSLPAPQQQQSRTACLVARPQTWACLDTACELRSQAPNRAASGWALTARWSRRRRCRSCAGTRRRMARKLRSPPRLPQPWWRAQRCACSWNTAGACCFSVFRQYYVTVLSQGVMADTLLLLGKAAAVFPADKELPDCCRSRRPPRRPPPSAARAARATARCWRSSAETCAQRREPVAWTRCAGLLHVFPLPNSCHHTHTSERF